MLVNRLIDYLFALFITMLVDSNQGIDLGLICNWSVFQTLCVDLALHPGLAEIRAHVGSQEVVATPSNADSLLVIICLDAGRVLQPVQDGSHLINVMICTHINRVEWVT